MSVLTWRGKYTNSLEKGPMFSGAGDHKSCNLTVVTRPSQNNLIFLLK
jgi:hypothetical protein